MDEPYDVRITAEGRRLRGALPEKIRQVALAFVFEALVHAPRRMGKPLTNEFAGLLSARRAEYRVIYEIDDDAHTILVHRVAHRRDAYRPR